MDQSETQRGWYGKYADAGPWPFLALRADLRVVCREPWDTRLNVAMRVEIRVLLAFGTGGHLPRGFLATAAPIRF